MIYTFVAYDLEKNLGRAYNKCMDIVPNDDDWVFFLDHDATFVQPDWYKNLNKIIEQNPEYDLFTCVMNRCGSRYQLVDGVDKNNHDIRYHREVGKKLSEVPDDKAVVDITNSQPLSGVVIIAKKKMWKVIGGAKDGFLGVDNDIHVKCRQNGMKVGLIRNLYVYHWYRADAHETGGLRPLI